MKAVHGSSNAKKITFNVINSRMAAISSFFDSMEANNVRWSKNEIKHKLADIIGRPTRDKRDKGTIETIETLGTPGTDGTVRTRVSFYEPWDSFILDGKLNRKWAQNTQKKWGTVSLGLKDLITSCIAGVPFTNSHKSLLNAIIEST